MVLILITSNKSGLDMIKTIEKTRMFIEKEKIEFLFQSLMTQRRNLEMKKHL